MDDDIVTFLAKKDNIMCVLEIADHIDAVKRSLLVNFWNMVKTRLDDKIKSSGGMKWKVELMNNPPENHGGIKLLPVPAIEQDLFLSFDLLQEKEYGEIFKIFCEATWREVKSDRSSIPEIASFIKAFECDGFEDCNDWAPFGWIYTNWHPGSNEFFIRVANENDNGTFEFSAEVADFFWGKFTNHRLQLEKINESLIGKEYS